MLNPIEAIGKVVRSNDFSRKQIGSEILNYAIIGGAAIIIRTVHISSITGHKLRQF